MRTGLFVILDSFIPIDRRLALSGGREIRDRCFGCVLVADIAGFTGAAERLITRYGPLQGVERLSERLNRVLDIMVLAVHRQQGTVISFNGDAITCWFEGLASERALRAAATMHEDFARLQADPSEDFLGIKVSFCQGSARRFVVGDPAIQRIEVVAGELLDRVEDIARMATRGETWICEGLLPWLGDHVGLRGRLPGHVSVTLISPASGPVPWPSAPPLPPAVVREWTPRHIHHLLPSEGGRLFAEFRLTSVFFVSFRGIDFDHDPEAAQRLDGFIREVQAITESLDGALLQVVLGDKGCYLYGAFGAPTAHEDDADRVVETAYRVIALPSKLPYIEEMRVGLSRGRVYAGTYGSSERLTYGVLGTEVNVAARLMQLADPGCILATPAVVREVDRSINAEPFGSHVLKGLSKPIELFRLQAPTTHPELRRRLLRASAPLVDRETERPIIQDFLSPVRSGSEPNSLVLEGEAGIGKSHLVQWAMARAREAGRLPLFGMGEAIERLTPYFPWRAIFLALHGLHPDLPAEVIRTRMEAVVAHDPVLLERIPLLDTLFPGRFPENDVVGRMNAEARADGLRRLLIEILRIHCQDGSRVLIVLDDVHCMDPASWTLVVALTEALPQIRFILATRPSGHEITHDFEDLIRRGRMLHLVLHPMEQKDSELLAEGILEGARLSSGLSRAIRTIGAGNPFFITETARALRDRSLITEAEGTWDFVSSDIIAATDFPTTITGVIMSRVDRLWPDAQQVLRVASIVGPQFSASILADIMAAEISGERLAECLAELDRRDIIVMTSPPDGYRFHHLVTQQVVYDTLLFTRRRSVHGAVARRIEVRHEGDLSPHLATLAHHWEQGGEPLRAAVYLDRLGEQALRRFANEEAERCFSSAMGMLEPATSDSDSVRRAGWELGLGEARVNLIQYKAATEPLLSGLARLGHRVPSSRTARLLAVVGNALRHLLPFRRRGLPTDPTVQASRIRKARALDKLSEIGFVAEDLALTYYATFSMLTVAERSQDSPELARCYAGLGTGFALMQIPWLANVYFKKAMVVSDHVGDPYTFNYVQMILALTDAGLGKWDSALRGIESVRESVRQSGDFRREGDLLSIQAAVQFFTGDLGAGEATATQLLEMYRDTSYFRNCMEALYLRGVLQIAGTRWDAAQATLQDMRIRMKRHPSMVDRFLTMGELALQALLDLGTGRDDEALKGAVAVIAVGRKGDPNIFSSFASYAAPAQVFMGLDARGRLQGVSAPTLDLAADLMQRFASVFRFGRPRVLQIRSWQAGRAGRREPQLRYAREAVRLAGELAMPLEIAQARDRLSRLEGGEGNG